MAELAAAPASGSTGFRRALAIPVAAVVLTVGLPRRRLSLRPPRTACRRGDRERQPARASRSDDSTSASTWFAPRLRAWDVNVTWPGGRSRLLPEHPRPPAWSLAWLRGAPALRIALRLPPGEVSGTVIGGAEPSFDGDLRQVSLALLPLQEIAPGVQLDGRVDATIDVTITEAGPLGSARFEAKQGSLVLPLPPDRRSLRRTQRRPRARRRHPRGAGRVRPRRSARRADGLGHRAAATPTRSGTARAGGAHRGARARGAFDAAIPGRRARREWRAPPSRSAARSAAPRFVPGASAPRRSRMSAESLQKVFKTLADPTRVRILALLEREELAVQELMDVLGMAQCARLAPPRASCATPACCSDRRDGTYVFYRFATPRSGAWSDAWELARASSPAIRLHERDAAALLRVVGARATRTRTLLRRGRPRVGRAAQGLQRRRAARARDRAPGRRRAGRCATSAPAPASSPPSWRVSGCA